MQLDKIINTAYSFGAAVVVFGAWAKLDHKDYSEIALTTGLLTETGIFFIYGLMEWRKPAPTEQAEQAQHPPTEPAEQTRQPSPANDHSFSSGPNTGELTDTLRQTNRILSKVFKTD